MHTGGALNLHNIYSGNPVNIRVLQLSVLYEHKMSYVVSTPKHATLSIYVPMLKSPFIHVSFTDGALNLPAVLAGVVVAFLLLTLLIAGIIVGAVLLRRKAHKRRMLSQRNAPQQKGNITRSSNAAKEDEGTEVHTYDVVGDNASTDGRAVLYQELNTRKPDYVSEYTKLSGRTYQELDFNGREEDHHYQQRTN